jgi:Ser/Thr protein kinase RdoA (MazF antagonist)
MTSDRHRQRRGDRRRRAADRRWRHPWHRQDRRHRATPVEGKPELVGHRDYCPGNVVFRAGLPAALIDFDLAKPTTRRYGIANALWWWAPLRDPRDRAPAFAGLDIPYRAAIFADAYGMTSQQRQDLVPLMARMAHRYHRTARAAADADPVFLRLWEQGAKDQLPRAEAWLKQASPAIAAQLTQTSSRA